MLDEETDEAITKLLAMKRPMEQLAANIAGHIERNRRLCPPSLLKATEHYRKAEARVNLLEKKAKQRLDWEVPIYHTTIGLQLQEACIHLERAERELYILAKEARDGHFS